MKTTIDISDKILAKAKRLAKKRNVSLRTIIEESLVEKLGMRKKEEFVLRDESYGTHGLSDEFMDFSWEQVRKEIYGD